MCFTKLCIFLNTALIHEFVGLCIGRNTGSGAAPQPEGPGGVAPRFFFSFSVILTTAFCIECYFVFCVVMQMPPSLNITIYFFICYRLVRIFLLHNVIYHKIKCSETDVFFLVIHFHEYVMRTSGTDAFLGSVFTCCHVM